MGTRAPEPSLSTFAPQQRSKDRSRVRSFEMVPLMLPCRSKGSLRDQLGNVW
jgi:hypothetical protein